MDVKKAAWMAYRVVADGVIVGDGISMGNTLSPQ